MGYCIRDASTLFFFINLLVHTNAAKTIVLKEGCPVILIRNISEGLFNGARGVVHSLKKDSLPVININDKICFHWQKVYLLILAVYLLGQFII
jgi:hypothetical protein